MQSKRPTLSKNDHPTGVTAVVSLQSGGTSNASARRGEMFGGPAWARARMDGLEPAKQLADADVPDRGGRTELLLLANAQHFSLRPRPRSGQGTYTGCSRSVDA